MSNVVAMRNDGRRRKIGTLQEAIDEIHRQFGEAQGADRKAESCRLYAGKLLLALRQRIEAGEAGEGVNWWQWYESKFVRSRKDAEKVMRLASADDPEAAHEADKIARMERRRSNIVDRAIELVKAMNEEQQRDFVAKLRRIIRV